MKRNFKLIGQLPGEKEVVLGYANESMDILKLHREYDHVYLGNIYLRIEQGSFVEEIPEEKKAALGNLLAALFGPLQMLGQQISIMHQNKRN